MIELEVTPRAESVLTDAAELRVAVSASICICLCLIAASFAGAQNASIVNPQSSLDDWESPNTAPQQVLEEEVPEMPTPDPNAAFNKWTFVSTPDHERDLMVGTQSFDMAELEAIQARRTERKRPRKRAPEPSCLCIVRSPVTD